MYTIKKFDKTNGNITFQNPQNTIEHTMNVLEYNDYRQVSPRHYYNAEHNEVILLQEPMSFRPFVPSIVPPSIEDEGKKYYPCEQWQFDKWHTKEYHSSHNAQIYTILAFKLQLH